MIKKLIAILLLSLVTVAMLVCCECEHQWDGGKVTKEATEQEQGVRVYTCSKCDETRTEAIERLAHTTHYYSSNFGSDATHHWLICDHEGCGTATNKAPHIWVEKHGGGEICQACRRIK